MSENKTDQANLVGGAPLVVEDLDVTMSVVTYQGPVRYRGFKRIWKNLTCRHDMSGKWFETSYCKKCGLMR